MAAGVGVPLRQHENGGASRRVPLRRLRRAPLSGAGKYRQYTVLFVACGVASALGNVSRPPSGAGRSV